MAEMNLNLHNPQLNGAPFFWEGGPVGILLLHGFTATPVEVRSAGEILHAHGYTVAGPLLPGHGTQPSELNRVHWQDWVQAAEDNYQRLAAQCSRVFLAGESMGAVTALYLATAHPEASGVIVFSPAVRLRLSLWDRWVLRLLAPFVESVKKGSLDAEGRWQGYQVNPLKATLQLLELQREVFGRMHLIRQPLFVALGRYDTTIDLRSGELVMQGVQSDHKELHWFEQSNHVILVDDELPEVMAAVEKFMEEETYPPAPSLKGRGE
jgi:carboxylesterase